MTTLINGAACNAISVTDRGFLYGDGVFRTLLLRNKKVRLWDRQYAKLLSDCNAINLTCPDKSLLNEELEHLTRDAEDGVVKIMVTRGSGQRGYAPPQFAQATHVLDFGPLPNFPESFATTGVRVHVCQLRLGYQPRLAGVKHLNRLENVLAASEWNAPDIAEGLLLDENGYVIEGVRSNIFMLKGDELFTPDLSRCGVSGVQRERIIGWAAQQGMNCKIANIELSELLRADEIFLVNSVIGLWPVREMPGYHREQYPLSRVIQNWLNHESD